MAIALACASCSAFLDLGGLSEPPAAGDASTATDGALDAGADGQTSGLEAGPDGTLPLCKTFKTTRFCSDFDSVTLNELPLETKNGTAAFDEISAVSAPRSLRLTTNATPTESAHAAIDTELGLAGPTTQLAFDIRIDEHASDYTEIMMVRAAETNGDYCETFLILNDSSDWILRSGCPGLAELPLGAIPLGQWTHIVFRIDAQTGSGSLQLGPTTKTFRMSPSFALGKLRVVAGIYYAKAGSGRIQMALDNVVVSD